MSFSNLVFHVGLHKTGTSFLQANIFPHLRDIEYLRWRNLEYFLRIRNSERYLISCESLTGYTFASREERRQAIHILGSMFKDASTMVIFRPHGPFVASLYSQYLRYGGTLPFGEFFDLGHSSDDPQRSGIINAASINYRAIIEDLETSFSRPPLVVIMEKMFDNPRRFLDDFCQYAGCSSGDAESHFSRRPVNAGLRRWQGRMLRRINEAAGAHLSIDGRDRPFSQLARFGVDPETLMVRRLAFIPSGPLVSTEEKQDISSRFSDDWDFTLQYAAAQKWKT